MYGLSAKQFGEHTSAESLDCMIRLTLIVAALLAPGWPAQGHDPEEYDLKKSYVARGFAYDTLFEGGQFVALTVHDETLYVSEKRSGKIYIYRDGRLQDEPVVDFDVDSFNERGLLGIALHPNFPKPPYLYAYYSVSVAPGRDTEVQELIPGNRLVRLTLAGDKAVEEEVLKLYEAPHQLGYHNGGILRFDSEGSLWVGVGDGLMHLERPQSLSFPHGKILRYDENGKPWPKNLYARDEDPETLAEIYSYGFRNPWNFTFHPEYGTLYATDNGARIEDEINVVEEGMNYGWPEVEGPADGWREVEFEARTPNYRNPIWSSGGKTTCPTGIIVALDRLGMDRHLIWAECNRPRAIWTARLAGYADQFLATDPVPLVAEMGRPVDLAWDWEGNLLVSNVFGDGGSVRRLRLVDPVAASKTLAPTLSDTSSPRSGESFATFGERLYSELDCWNCHSTDGSRRTGPTLKGVFGKERRLQDGTTVKITGSYIRESLLRPNAKVSEGFRPEMPSYAGKLTEKQMQGLVSYVRSLR